MVTFCVSISVTDTQKFSCVHVEFFLHYLVPTLYFENDPPSDEGHLRWKHTIILQARLSLNIYTNYYFEANHEVAEVLIRNGANVNARMYDNWTKSERPLLSVAVDKRKLLNSPKQSISIYIVNVSIV